ncbi:apolipoprotein N-acyltransferase [Synechococcus sp. CS-602]|uniref:apolipoprotein N-acyltransferase n=1 Tax=Synechococcaceae TaxID=1890426 RepID=UPI0008FF6767|nr:MULTISPECIES: apolipoprotein N-acyltransferase [Synechococcaceae]MCT4363431.1 apolipoprotein N-acyltransferase [Candidatus Regnicoccus frigidus MAG-AL1]APD48487.1 apolipoprotein N-acyltransferase [Synechococcus sp. SynAce01]MCT0205277.1 apolipoprotein N-acyltransferase [Synechococcus sp. CS-602]MCT0246771.1 apolipoprotein N-acyltransferase [Synechococcus sp. CS-601]MCT4367926.1 apolipoprotein N-acyltransferase [Candidatus Regnicoccus frigidus MAG-AL2]
MGDDRQPGWVVSTPVAALAGTLAGLSLAPLGWPPLLWLALVPLWGQSLRDSGARGRKGLGAGVWAAGLWGGTAVLASHRWLLWLHPLDWVGIPLPLSLPVCLALWLGCGLAAAILVALWSVLVRWLGPRRWSTAVLTAAIWGLAEVWLSRSPLFWIGLGTSPLPGDRALAGLGALGGAALVAAAQLLIAWLLWRALEATAAARVAAKVGRRRSGNRSWWLGFATLTAALHLLGWSQLPPARAERGASVEVLVLQPAVPTREKFEPGRQRRLLEQLAAARQQAAQEGLGPLLLPEGSLVLGQNLPSQEPVEVLSGGFRQEGEELRSSVLRFGPDQLVASSWIDKHRLVPLGEWVPLARLWRWSGLSAVGGVEPGARSRLLPRPEGAIGVAICYELSDGQALAAASRNGAGWLLASANLDPYPLLLQAQFSALAQLRAIETGRWLVSSANTGPSQVIDSQGKVRRRLPAGQAATARFKLDVLSGLTPYARWQEAPLLALVIVAAGAAYLLPGDRP